MNLSAGFGRQDISSNRNLSLVGYGQRLDLHGVGNAGMLDPLYVRALALSYEKQTLILLSFDLCVLTPSLVETWTAQLAAALELPGESIMLASSHTHSAPHPRVASNENEFFQLATGTDEADVQYGEKVLSCAIVAATDAMAELKPHTLFFNQGNLGLGYNRRVPTADGIQMCWNPKEFPQLRPHPSPDPHVAALVFLDAEGGEIVLWSAGAHPVVLGKESNVVSADWPGFACSELERLHPNRRALFVLGPCGEVHPWIATQSDPNGVAAVGAVAARFVDLLSRGAHAPQLPQLKFIQRPCQGMRLTGWNIGDVLLLGVPVELFCSLSRRLHETLKKPLLIATLANGWHAYFPDHNAFSEGAYEVEVARSCGRLPGDGEALVQELESIARHLS